MSAVRPSSDLEIKGLVEDWAPVSGTFSSRKLLSFRETAACDARCVTIAGICTAQLGKLSTDEADDMSQARTNQRLFFRHTPFIPRRPALRRPRNGHIPANPAPLTARLHPRRPVNPSPVNPSARPHATNPEMSGAGIELGAVGLRSYRWNCSVRAGVSLSWTAGACGGVAGLDRWGVCGCCWLGPLGFVGVAGLDRWGLWGVAELDCFGVRGVSALTVERIGRCTSGHD